MATNCAHSVFDQPVRVSRYVTESNIFLPFFGTMILTFVVWIYMYVRRLSYLHANKVDHASIATPVAGARVIPHEVSLAAYNLRNLLELPILFYAVCLYLFVTGNVDSVQIASAWWFFVFRVGHTVVHCTSNYVPLRFSLYILSSVGLWIMVVRAAVGAFGW